MGGRSNRGLCWLLVACMFGMVGSVNAEEPLEQLMRKKLVYTRDILGALAMEDFATIENRAQALDELTLTQWRKTDEPRYRSQLKVFRFATDELSRFAKERNLDGAALANVQLTLSCVNCHRSLRAR